MPGRRVSLHIKISAPLHQALKMVAVQECTTIAAFVEETLRDRLSVGGERWLETAERTLRRQGKLGSDD